MSLSLAAGRQLVESFPFMTDWGQRGSASRADKSEACYVVDGEAGDDPGALRYANRTAGLGSLIALGVSGQPAWARDRPAPALEFRRTNEARPVSAACGGTDAVAA